MILASAFAGRPVVLRIARDFCPLPVDSMRDPHLRRFFLGISFLWGATQLLNSGITLWLPLIVQGMGFSNLATSFIVALPFVGAMVAMIQAPDKKTYIVRQGDKFADGTIKTDRVTGNLQHAARLAHVLRDGLAQLRQAVDGRDRR